MNDASASADIAPSEISGNPEGTAAEATLPADAEGWRSLIAQIPPRELLRVLLKDKAVQGKVFAGFRPGADTLRRNLVVQRVVDLVQKDGKLATQIADLLPPQQPEPPLSDPQSVESPREPTEERVALQEPPPEDPRLQAKLKLQRADLREKDALIASLKAQVNTAERGRDAALRLAAKAEAARRLSETEAERERHHRQRAMRRDEQSKSPAAAAAKPPAVGTAISAAAPTSNADGLLIEGLERLMSRAKYKIVAEVCRESIAASENGIQAAAGIRGQLHALYAACLYGLGHAAEAAAEDQNAAALLLDGGDLIRATNSLGRILVSAPAVRPAALAALFRRLLALGDKMGQLEPIANALTHVRIASPEANQRLQTAIRVSGAGKIYESLQSALATRHIGPDEMVALPTKSERASAVSPRSIARAVEAGDGAFIADCRAGIRLLQSQGSEQSAIVNSLLESIVAIDPLAVVPLAQSANQPVVVDASNVARHNPDPLSLAKVTRVENIATMRNYLLRRGFFPVLLIADANLRFKVDDKPTYLDLVARGIVKESPPGTSADEEILSVAGGLHAPVVTNDRLADWGERASDTERLGFLFDREGPSLTTF